MKVYTSLFITFSRKKIPVLFVLQCVNISRYLSISLCEKPNLGMSLPFYSTSLKFWLILKWNSKTLNSDCHCLLKLQLCKTITFTQLPRKIGLSLKWKSTQGFYLYWKKSHYYFFYNESIYLDKLPKLMKGCINCVREHTAGFVVCFFYLFICLLTLLSLFISLSNFSFK